MTCEQAIAILGDYLEATLDADDVDDLEAHLAGCDECVSYLGTYRKTPELVARAGRIEIPTEMKRRLRELLVSKLSDA